jgi:oxalate decarboxylase/phosphoglucose isomerase-like protein (cupin superfamily)
VATDTRLEPQAADKARLRYLLDTYLDWCRAQSLPIVESVAVDLLAIETAPWRQLGPGVRGAFVHLAGRGDFCALQVIDIEPGGRTAWQKHLYDEVFYVLTGHGSTTVEIAKGKPLDFEWGPRALFSPPLNCPFRLFNGSGRETVRLVVATNLPFLLNVFRSERFLFDNPKSFPERVGRDAYYAGEGDFLPLKPGKHMWETNFVPDLGSFSLPEWEARGAGSRNIKLILADSAMHAHSSEMPVGTYKKAHRHGAGAHVFAVTGSGYTLMWNEGDSEFERHEWRHGWVFAPPEDMFHQHFNTGAEPARYLALSLGSHRYPVLARKVARKENPEASIKEGGLQLDYADQDPRIHRIWLAEMKKAGLDSRMGKYFDEAKIAAEVRG